MVAYDNSEVETVLVGLVQSEEDFGPPVPGATLCVKNRGTKYSAVVKDIIQEVCLCVHASTVVYNRQSSVLYTDNVGRENR